MTWLLDAIALLLGVHVREEAHVAIVRQLDTTAAGGGGQPQRVSALRALRRGSLHRLGIRGRGAYALHNRVPLRSWGGCATAVRLRTQVVYVPSTGAAQTRMHSSSWKSGSKSYLGW